MSERHAIYLRLHDFLKVFGSNCELKATWLALESKLKFYSNLYFSNAALKHMILSLLAYVLEALLR